MDTDGYPTDQELARIRDWPIDNEGEIGRLLTFVRELWRYADAGYWRQRGRTYRISTAGWSGNESIIGALQGNRLFWLLCWQSSRRGGHYVFHIPMTRSTAAAPAESPTKHALHERNNDQHDRSLPTMRCRTCGLTGDDVHDFISTAIPGERRCPQCESDQCFIVKQPCTRTPGRSALHKG